MSPPPLLSRHLGRRDWTEVAEEMRRYTLARDAASADELWFLEHPPVFTQGQAGKAEHVLAPGDIPVVQADRGGQVTYHGPGQLVVYVLLDLQRAGYGIRALVTRLEQSLVELLAGYGIAAHARREAPGVYVGDAAGAGAPVRKIASLGLRVRNARSYHGLALNVAMDLAPFGRINPCGYQGLQMTQVSELGGPARVDAVAADLEPILRRQLASAQPS